MKRGILIYHPIKDEWTVWIGQQPYGLEEGSIIDIRIQNHYYRAYLEKDFDWSITLSGEVTFSLHRYEVYKVRINTDDYFSPHIIAPF